MVYNIDIREAATAARMCCYHSKPRQSIAQPQNCMFAPGGTSQQAGTAPRQRAPRSGWAAAGRGPRSAGTARGPPGHRRPQDTTAPARICVIKRGRLAGGILDMRLPRAVHTTASLPPRRAIPRVRMHAQAVHGPGHVMLAMLADQMSTAPPGSCTSGEPSRIAGRRHAL